ncbi:MAG: hypothetical protein M1832_000036 [Thelocarpon impressellum]|nr:MAG: hypothetical protein M1832_000036 [Thelocarpon impressellum]
MEVSDILVSQDPAQLEPLGQKRRAAGESVIARLLETIDAEALRARAESLRSGIRCTIKFPTPHETYHNVEVLGGRNYHASLTFADGQQWLARFRLPNHNYPPLKERNFDRRSEFAVYRFLATTSVPAPEAFAMADDDDPTNPVGAGYILLDKVPGKAMEWHEATDAQKDHFFRQLADAYVELERHPFPAVGRLTVFSPTPVADDLPAVGTALFDYEASGKPIPLGPFRTSRQYYEAWIVRQMKLLGDGQLGCSVPADLYLVYRTLLEHLPEHDEAERLYLRHVDSRDANFLVDDAYKITGIIDWELAVIVPARNAFQSPLLMYDLGDIYDDQNLHPSPEEQCFAQILRDAGHDSLATWAAQKVSFGYEQCLDTDPHRWDDIVASFAGWWKAATATDTFDWPAWREEAVKKYGDGGFKDPAAS